MRPAPDFTTYRFPERPWWAARYLGPRLLLAGLAALLGYAWLRRPHSMAGHTGFACAALFLLSCLRRLSKSPVCLTLEPELVRLDAADRSRTLYYSGLRGFREVQQADGRRTTLLELMEPGLTPLTLDSTYPGYACIRALLAARVPDLGLGEPAGGDLAAAPPARVLLAAPPPAAVALTRLVERLWAVSFGLMLVVLPIWPYELATPVLLAVPLLTAGLYWRHASQVQLTSEGPHSDRQLWPGLLLVGAFGAASTFLRFNFVSFRPLWGPLAVGAAGLGLALLAGYLRSPRRALLGAGTCWVALGAAACFGYTAAVFVNCAWPAAPRRQAAVITGFYRTTGRNASSHLYLAAEPGTLTVRDAYYGRKQAGDTLTLVRYPGRLGADFYRLPPAADPDRW